MKKFFTLFFIALNAFGYAQFPNFQEPTYFQDDEQRRIDIILSTIKTDDGLIFSFTQQNRGFGVMKMDFRGNTVWTTNYESPHHYYPSDFKIQLMKDGYIYGISMGKHLYYDPDREMASIWKIDSRNGDVIWVRDHESSRKELMDLAEVNSENLALIYYLDSTVSYKSAYLSTLDKSTGDFLKTRKLNTHPWYAPIQLEVDDEQNMIAFVETQMWCFKNGNTDSIKWEKKYHQDAELKKLFLDKTDSLYLLYEDEKDVYTLQRIDNNSGKVRINAIGNGRSVEFDNMIDTDSFLYAIDGFQSTGIGVYKFAKSDGRLIWQQGHVLSPPGSKARDNWVNSAFINPRGDLIFAGFHKFYPLMHVCSMIKVSGENGQLLNRKTVSDFKGEEDTESEARFITEHNGELFLLAHLNYEEDHFYSKLIRFDTAFNRKIDWDVRSNRPFTSRTLDIKKHKDQMIVFKQKGATVLLESYTLSGQLEWSREYSPSYFAQGGRMLVEDGFAYISFTNYNEHAFLDHSFSTVSDQPAFMQMNRVDLRNGGLVGSDTFHTDAKSLNTMQLLGYNNKVYILYERSGFPTLRIYQNDQFGLGRDVGSGHYTVVRDMRDKNEFNGRFNLMTIYNNSLYCVNAVGIHKLSLDLQSSKRIHDFGKDGKAVYMDLLVNNDNLYFCGQSLEGGATFSSFDLIKEREGFEKFIPGFYSYTQVKLMDSNIILAGSSGGKAFFSSYNIRTFKFNWHKQIDTTQSLTIVHSFKVFKDKEAIVWTGARVKEDHTTDGVIGFTKLDGTPVLTYTLTDSLMGRSTLSCMELSNDTTLWLGGAHNTHSVNHGLIGVLTLDTSFRFVQQDTGSGSIAIQEHRARVYPNPSNGIVIVEVPGQEILNCTLFTSSGVELSCSSISKSSSQVILKPKDIKSGIYILKIRTNSGVITRKLSLVGM